MRIFAVSDIHIEYEENRKWLSNLTLYDHQEDFLILAGDIANQISLIVFAFKEFKKRFSEVFYVPGNHELWTFHHNGKNSIEIFGLIEELAHNYGISMKPGQLGSLSIIPLFGWYDYSFGQPSDELMRMWCDYPACKWPDGFDEYRIARYFTSKNENFLHIKNHFIITFSHFLPRIDVMPAYIPPDRRIIYPVLGTSLIESQIRHLGSQIHVYGHSHLNRQVLMDNTLYVNNAFGYPYEKKITDKRIKCIYCT